MKKIFSFIVIIVLVATFALPAQAVVSFSKEDYLTNYANYKDFYNNEYVTSYNTYNAALADLATRISNTDFETVEQAQRVIDFLNDLTSRRDAFFGDRETVGTSRYIVPTLRTAMFDAAAAGDYNSAYFHCDELTLAVQDRVDFLTSLKDEINAFEVIVSTGIADVSVSFTVTSGNAWWYSYTMVVTNTSDTAIQDWTLLLNVDGHINNANFTGSGFNAWGPSTSAGYTQSFSNGVFSLSPQNEWQAGYVLPAGSSITFVGGGSSINGITSATIDGEPVEINFSK